MEYGIIWDQRCTMEWVRENIGVVNAGNVTLAGRSAGAAYAELCWSFSG